MIKAIEKGRQFAEGIAALMLGSMFVCFLTQIGFRYILGWPVGWTIEYVSMTWLFCILFGYAFVVRNPEIIRLDIVYTAMPRNIQRAMDVIAQTFCAAVMLWSLPQAIDYINFMQIERTAYMRVNFALLFSIYVPFSIAVSIRCLMSAWDALRGHPNDPAVLGETKECDCNV